MISRRAVKFLGWAGIALAAAVLAFFAGRALKPDEKPHYVFDSGAAAYVEAGQIGAVSKGGFSGFGDLEGGQERTVIAGRVVELTPSSLVLEGPTGARTSLRLGPQPRISRLLPATREQLRPGVTVEVRLGDSPDQAVAVLVLSQP